MSDYMDKMRRIHEYGSASTIYISHGASGDWFVVEPQVGTEPSMAGTSITTEMAVNRLLRGGRTVYALKPQPWMNKVEGKGSKAVDEPLLIPLKAQVDQRRGWFGLRRPR